MARQGGDDRKFLEPYLITEITACWTRASFSTKDFAVMDVSLVNPPQRPRPPSATRRHLSASSRSSASPTPPWPPCRPRSSSSRLEERNDWLNASCRNAKFCIWANLTKFAKRQYPSGSLQKYKFFSLCSLNMWFRFASVSLFDTSRDRFQRTLEEVDQKTPGIPVLHVVPVNKFREVQSVFCDCTILVPKNATWCVHWPWRTLRRVAGAATPLLFYLCGSSTREGRWDQSNFPF